MSSDTQSHPRASAAEQVVAKKRVKARGWPCCVRLEEALTQLEHHSREVHAYTDFSATDMLDYLQQEAAQPNDHEQRLLVTDSGPPSPNGLALLLCFVGSAAMEGILASGGEEHSRRMCKVASVCIAAAAGHACDSRDGTHAR